MTTNIYTLNPSSAFNTAVTPSLATADTSQPSASQIASADSSFQQLLNDGNDAKSTLADITSGGVGGYWAWKMKELKSQIADQVMNSMGLTPDKIAGMDAKDRVSTENKIEAMVQQQLKLQISEDMKRKHQGTLAASASMSSVIKSTQDIGNIDPLNNVDVSIL